MTRDKDSSGQFLLIYASQTGQAKAIAEEFNEVTTAAGLAPDLHCFSLAEKKFCLERASIVVFLTSTTGDGEPPETAVRLWRRLKRATLPNNHLAHLRYSLLGLGDSNYNNFCNFGKSLNRRLLELGAKEFFPSSWADDATGLELAAEPWMEGVLAALKEEFSLPPTTHINGGASGDCKTELSSDSNIVLNPVTNIISVPLEIVSVASNDQSGEEVSIDQSEEGVGKLSDESNKTTDELKSELSVSVTHDAGDVIALTLSVSDSILTNNDTTQKPIDSNLTNRVTALELIDSNLSNNITASVLINCNLSNHIAASDLINSNLINHMTTSDQNNPMDARGDHLSPEDCGKVDTTHPGQVTGPTNITDMDAGKKAYDIQTAVKIPAEQLVLEELKDVVNSLIHSSPPLSTGPLTLPLFPPRFLKVTFHPEKMIDQSSQPIQNNCAFSGAESSVLDVPICAARRLTRHDALKTALELELDITSCQWRYEPGDTIGVVCPNTDVDVDYLISRLGLKDLAHTSCTVELSETTLKKNAAVPEYIPPSTTVHHILSTCCEITQVPRKVLLRAFSDVTSNEGERRRLQELCSKQGADHYTRYIRETGVTLIDVLHAFPSCQPTFDLLLEHFQRLLPRPYSVASSPLHTPDRLRIVFNVVHVSAGDGRHGDRRGVCTGWLDRLTNHTQSLSTDSSQTTLSVVNYVSVGMSELNLTQPTDKDVPPLIPIFLRKNLHFHMPTDLATPMVMIGPGTGVAPFIGFLQHRERLVSKMEAAGVEYGDTWLFYGCRHRDRDYLYREELEGFLSRGVLTNLLVAFSRDNLEPNLTTELLTSNSPKSMDVAAPTIQTKTSSPTDDVVNDPSPSLDDEGLVPQSLDSERLVPRPRHVQDIMRLSGPELTTLIFDKHASVFVCGDARGMASQVLATFKQLLISHKGLDEAAANAFLMKMRLEKKYLEDVWT